MKLSELKKLLKPLVKECINEVLAEQYLRTLSEAARPTKQSIIGNDEPPRSVAQVLTNESKSNIQPQRQKNESLNKAALRERLKEHSIASDSDMAKLYEDSLQNTVPAQEKGMDVSESMMQKVGVYDKDYSRYL